MKTTILVFSVLFLLNTSCINNPKSSNTQIDSVTQFDKASATLNIEKQSKAFEQALIDGDSIAVGDIYTVDTKIIPYISGRDGIVKSAGSMIRNNETLQFTIKNLWGDENIIIEDAYVEFYDNKGELTSQGDVLLVWKKDGDEWRIFRDVYKPKEE